MKHLILLSLIVILLLSSCTRDTAAVKSSEPAEVFINLSFDFTEDDLKKRLSGLPRKAAENPREFLTLAEGMLEMPPEYLVLVDKEHALPEEFIPADILDLDSFDELETGKNGLSLDREASDALVQLSKAAREDGITLLISSAYRSYEYQQGLFKRYADRDGEEAASRYSARAGTSQHQLGTTVDLGSISDSFAESRAGEWMAENAGGYGWSLSYPRNFEEETGYKWESWHWRWIGVDAVKMQDEFFNGVQQRLLIFWNENASRIREAHAAADQESVGLNHSGLIPRRKPQVRQALSEYQLPDYSAEISSLATSLPFTITTIPVPTGTTYGNEISPPEWGIEKSLRSSVPGSLTITSRRTGTGYAGRV